MKRLGVLAVLAAMLVYSLPVGAHAFPRHADPGAGAVLAQAPERVTIHFDSELAQQASTLIVKDQRGMQVSAGEGQVDARDGTMIYTRLNTRARGIYHVYWAVTDREGHHTRGDYAFTVR